ncbi:MAG TPA: SH3 domain-containing protein [bacterium]|nr:SH3 domain-containing protein [bacterium]HPN36673.1 SH3 domain-containing protein [bacterium]
MIHNAAVGTVRRLTLAVALLWLFPPIVQAQAFDTTPPIIAHQPQKLGRQGRPLPLAANIADSSGVKAVQLKITYEGEAFEGSMPVINENEAAPVAAKILTDQLPVYAGPGTTFKKVGVLSLGQQVLVTMVRDPFLRIRSDQGLSGYIDAQSAQVIARGRLYGVTVPANITQSAFLSYQIIAIDAFGNESKTEPIEVRLIDDKQLAKLQARAGLTPKAEAQPPATVKPLSARKPSPFYTKPVFWLAAAAAGGGAYYLLSGGDEEEAKESTVFLSIEW